MEIPAKKKLLILITKSNFGGAQKYVYDLSRSLKDRYETVVACGGEGLMKTKIEAAGIRTISLPFLIRDVNPLKDIASLFSIISLIKKERPDIVHVNSSKMGILGLLAVRVVRIIQRRPIRALFTAHAWAFNEDRSDLSKTLIKFIHWTTVMLSDETIAVSEMVKKQISNLPWMEKKIQVIHLGLENTTPLPQDEARKILGLQKKGFSIGTIAELHPVKGLEFGLEAIRSLPFECSYTIIGEGDLRKNLEQVISADPILSKRVKLAGFVPDAARVLPAFDIFLLPSISEAFGYVLLEAGNARVPVIATCVGGIPEIIEDMKSGILIHPKNSKEIEIALTHLSEDDVIRDNLAFSLLLRVKKEFSLEKMVQNTIAVYEK